jgi:hypothetical protein
LEWKTRCKRASAATIKVALLSSRRVAMPRHDATTWKLPRGYEGVVGNANIEVEVRQSAQELRGKGVRARKRSSDLLGHLLISKGGLEWRPRGGKYNRKMNWEQFAEIMEFKS